MKTHCKSCLMHDKLYLYKIDENGNCKYCNEFNKIKKKKDISKYNLLYKLKFLSRKIRKETKEKQFNCLIGVSGGVDSSFVAYICKKMSLNALLVHFDNGWNSPVAIKNIYNLSKFTKFKLITYVIDWDEFKSLQRSFIKSSVVDIEMLTDHAIIATLFKVAKENNIKYIMSGDNYWTENGMPKSWTWNKLDKKNIQDINEKFENIKISKFPLISFFEYIKYIFFSKYKVLKVLNEFYYQRNYAIKILSKKINFIDYEDKHYESIFTKFYQKRYLPEKFGIDKRMTHLSALIRNNEITKEYALELMKKKLYVEKDSHEINFVIKKLGFDIKEMNEFFLRKEVQHNFYKSEMGFWNIFFYIKNLLNIKFYK